MGSVGTFDSLRYSTERLFLHIVSLLRVAIRNVTKGVVNSGRSSRLEEMMRTEVGFAPSDFHLIESVEFSPTNRQAAGYRVNAQLTDPLMHSIDFSS